MAGIPCGLDGLFVGWWLVIFSADVNIMTTAKLERDLNPTQSIFYPGSESELLQQRLNSHGVECIEGLA